MTLKIPTVGLYHKAILMGMYNFSPVVITSHENASIAYDIATAMGYDEVKGENKRLLTFFKNINIPRLILARTEQLLHSVISSYHTIFWYITY